MAAGFGRHGMPRPPLTLTFDRLTLKLVCESHLKWGTFFPNLGTLGLWVLELFAMYATDGQTDGRTDKSNAYCPFPTVGGIIIIIIIMINRTKFNEPQLCNHESLSHMVLRN